MIQLTEVISVVLLGFSFKLCTCLMMHIKSQIHSEKNTHVSVPPRNYACHLKSN